MKRTVHALDKLNWKRACVVFVLFATMAIALPAQTFSTLSSFDGTDGSFPRAGSLVQTANGDFYGTTGAGGANSSGTVFKISPSGTLTTLYSFCSQPDCTDGSNPWAGLIQATDGNFYGTTLYGGAYGVGTVFKITPTGALTTLSSFCRQPCANGAIPRAGLVQATDGNFYGTTQQGGANGNHGTVFKVTPSGTLTTLYSFCTQSGCTDGADPVAGLTQATDGDLYGTTQSGGSPVCYQGCGAIFKITLGGALTTLYRFGGADGKYPYAGLVQAANGDFYGTTFGGDAPAQNYGTVFKITPAGALTTLHGFCSLSGCVDGSAPAAPLVQATDGNLYGTTSSGGDCGGSGAATCGTVFKIIPSGTLTTLYSFDYEHGEQPWAGLVQATNGDFYGTTEVGGASGGGAVFRLSVGLPPFVKTQPHFAAVGAAITLLGTDLTGATSVTFNGIQAAFEIVSATELTTTVPAGATTGSVQVTTPGGTLSSGGPFLVAP